MTSPAPFPLNRIAGNILDAEAWLAGAPFADDAPGTTIDLEAENAEVERVVAERHFDKQVRRAITGQS